MDGTLCRLTRPAWAYASLYITGVYQDGKCEASLSETWKTFVAWLTDPCPPGIPCRPLTSGDYFTFAVFLGVALTYLAFGYLFGYRKASSFAMPEQ